MEQIKYHDGYKYQLVDDYELSLVDIQPEQAAEWKKLRVITDYVIISKGKMTVFHGYSWDGPSGPTIDTKNFMRGSLVHDVFYQLIRERVLNELTWRIHADEILRRICIEDGMSAIRAWWVYQGVRFGGYHAVAKEKPLLVAPTKG